jgi:hypothetical protein
MKMLGTIAALVAFGTAYSAWADISVSGIADMSPDYGETTLIQNAPTAPSQKQTQEQAPANKSASSAADTTTR